jgi:hypothetical protein
MATQLEKGTHLLSQRCNGEYAPRRSLAGRFYSVACLALNVGYVDVHRTLATKIPILHSLPSLPHFRDSYARPHSIPPRD